MPWKKNNVEWVPPLVIDGIAWHHPDRQQLIAAGYAWSDPPATAADYDAAAEAHLLAERTARGYTTREPDFYLSSSVERWAQDARDWVAHRDAVMLYALEIRNRHAAGGSVPALDDFCAALPKIRWTIEDPADEQ